MPWPAAVLLALAAVAVPSAAGAASFYETYLAARDGTVPCYARTYTGEHLAENPEQRVTRIFLTHSEYDDLKPPRTFEVVFGFELRGVDDRFSSEAGCGPEGKDMVCSVEGDGGSFRLRANGESIRVINEDRLVLEGSSDFSPDLAEGGDDRVLILHPSPPEACGFDPGTPAADPTAPQLSRPENEAAG